MAVGVGGSGVLVGAGVEVAGNGVGGMISVTTCVITNTREVAVACAVGATI